MIGIILGAWSAFRSSRVFMYGAAILAFAGALLLALSQYGNRRESEGATKVASKAAKRVVENMEKARGVRSKIDRLPLSDRADRLRGTDRRND